MNHNTKALLKEANQLYCEMWLQTDLEEAKERYLPLIKAKKIEAVLSYDTINESNILDALCLVDSQWVWEGFEAICQNYDLNPKAYNIGLKLAWSNGKGTGVAIPYFQKADGKLMMNAEELDYYNKLPDIVTLYRGCNITEIEDEDSCLGISWTISRGVAEFFAFRYTEEGRVVVSITVPKSNIITFINDRKEYECICLNIGADVTVVTKKHTQFYDDYLGQKKQYYS